MVVGVVAAAKAAIVLAVLGADGVPVAVVAATLAVTIVAAGSRVR